MLLATGVLMVVIAAGVIFSTLLEYNKSGSLYEETQQKYVSVNEEAKKKVEAVDTIIPDVQSEDTEASAWWNDISVDLAGLGEENSDIIGWIYFENEDISYPILYSGDNTTYLRTTYKGEQSTAGSIFLDGESTPDFSDPNVLIYGHNMRDLSMFGRLRYYKTNKDYYENHQYFQIITADKVYRYQVFAAADVKDNDQIYYAYGPQPSDFEGAVDHILSRSYLKTDLYNDDDSIVTLSTCTSVADDERLVICAVRADEHDI
jgi:sortase B